ncbi:winged helix family transcriptional regulator [Mucilaginibacter terrenus]|uniref:Winged helix family transcriptional regulator n=1 Tax=Mucilaginibacter terrenus TaxID=2482727 RepID=A0A3E2NWP0_9SPHI|nr:winged helix-turn-helix domain-containing protein [Mucilaginibacter terrenus]RFZ85425.1 winged helix family transcriptional regulator [Mucilaginibacter terrenus]
MADSRNLLSGKLNYVFAAITLLLISTICVAFGMAQGDDFDLARREILLRRIGHELLLQSGDSTSRVLPVKKIANNEYQISFEKDFTFLPDSLVNTTRRLLAKDPLAGDYVVNVLNSGGAGITYGYAVSENKKYDIVACIGRKQPKAYYTINIKFKPGAIITVRNKILLGGLPFLALVGFVLFRYGKPPKALTEVQYTNTLTLGQGLFDAKNRKLFVNGNTTELTGTETRLLRIFALAPNEIIERSRLQKEIWEDEGVIVGRSLDMFISKLRKKLEADATVKIIVVRSKGYKLDVNQPAQI